MKTITLSLMLLLTTSVASAGTFVKFSFDVTEFKEGSFKVNGNDLTTDATFCYTVEWDTAVASSSTNKDKTYYNNSVLSFVSLVVNDSAQGINNVELAVANTGGVASGKNIELQNKVSGEDKLHADQAAMLNSSLTIVGKTSYTVKEIHVDPKGTDLFSTSSLADAVSILDATDFNTFAADKKKFDIKFTPNTGKEVKISGVITDVTAVPEPSMFAFMGVGVCLLIAVGFVRSRRDNKSQAA